MQFTFLVVGTEKEGVSFITYFCALQNSGCADRVLL